MDENIQDPAVAEVAPEAEAAPEEVATVETPVEPATEETAAEVAPEEPTA